MLPAALDTDRILRETFVARVEHHRTLASTNDRARMCLGQGPATLPLLIVADQQTAGRGRGANRWWTGQGSLAMSLLVDGPALGIQSARSPLVALAAAVAVADAVAPLLASHCVGLHWPNDVMADGRKVAGILVEVVRRRFHILGIGLNTNNALDEAPPELQAAATTIFELSGRRHDHTSILLVLLDKLAGQLRRLAAEPHEIARRAHSLCQQRGRKLAIQSGRRFVEGRCAGIASDGALLLDTPDGRQAFHSGVLQRRTADGGR